MSGLETINPAVLGAPRGYSNGLLAPPGARLLFVAGQIAWNERQEIVSDEFADQFDQALANVLTIVAAAGGTPAAIGQLTIFVVDKAAYVAALAEIGRRYRARMNRHFPTMALVEIKSLLEPRALVEIQALAAIGGSAP